MATTLQVERAKAVQRERAFVYVLARYFESIKPGENRQVLESYSKLNFRGLEGQARVGLLFTANSCTTGGRVWFVW